MNNYITSPTTTGQTFTFASKAKRVPTAAVVQHNDMTGAVAFFSKNATRELARKTANQWASMHAHAMAAKGLPTHYRYEVVDVMPA